ncbi:MAG: MgtC/SapB family protein [Cyanobacteria bacterium J06639_1]
MLVPQFAIALAIGLIIGLERGWASRETQVGLRSPGVRTFGFVGLLGGIAAQLAVDLGANVLAGAFAALGAILAVSYALTAKQSQDFGITTEFALLLTFSLGGLAVQGYEIEALGIAAIVAILLGLKQEVHRVVTYLDRRELRATLQLLLLSVAVLPLLPDRDLGPWAALNPRTIGLLVLLIAGISYVGYFSIKLLGARTGILLSGLLGGLTSSTAVTVAFARMARQDENTVPLLGAGITLAAATMVPRLLLEIAVINTSVLQRIALPTVILAIVPLLAAIAIARRPFPQAQAAKLEVDNPLDLKSAFGFGLLLTALFVLVRAAEARFGQSGIYALAALSGIADVDAVSISLAQSVNGNASGTLNPAVAATGILLAAWVNTAVKACLASFIGGRALARWCATILAIALGASLLSTLVFL